MRSLIVGGVVIVIVLAIIASLAGALSYGHDRYRTHVTPRGETVQVQDQGIYRFSVKSLVVSGIPWDFVRLFFMMPLLIVATVLYVRSSLRGSMLLVGALASLFYQYMLWTFDWAYNSLYLAYVALFAISLCTGMLILANTDLRFVASSVGRRFPVRTAATFSFVLGGVLLFKVLGEIVPSIGTGAMPASGYGYYTMVDQALDLGLLVPLCIGVGIMLLRGRPLGYLVSAIPPILFLSIGLPVVAGEVALGLNTGQMNIGGILAFSVLMAVAAALLVRILLSIKPNQIEREPAEALLSR